MRNQHRRGLCERGKWEGEGESETADFQLDDAQQEKGTVGGMRTG